MCFTRKKTIITYNYILDSSSLCKLSEFSDLGVILDTKLTFTDHYNFIVKKANKILGFIKRFSRDFCDPYVLKLLYISFVRPVLEYGCVIWAPYYSVHINRLEGIQRRFLRFCLRFLPWSQRSIHPPYSHRLLLINLPSLLQHRKYLQLCFIVKLINGSIICPSTLCRLNFSYSQTSIRRQLPLCPIFSRTNYGVNSPLNQLISVFNKYYFLISSVNDNVKSKTFKENFFNIL